MGSRPYTSIGGIVFFKAHRAGIMTPPKVENNVPSNSREHTHIYPCFSPFVYSLDTFLPIVELHQKKYWLPDATKQNGRIYRWYLWFHIFVGYFLTTLMV